jgi:hypothetical protein
VPPQLNQQYQPTTPMRPSSSQQLGVGDCVTVKPKPNDSGGAKKLGRVQRLRSSGAVDVFYADGRVEERVGRDRLMPPKSPAAVDSKTPRSSRTARAGGKSNKSPAAADASAKRDSARLRTSYNDEEEEKAPAPTAAISATQRRARTAESRTAATPKKREPTDPAPRAVRAAQKQPARRQRDLSESVAHTQKQVADILETITATADAVAVVSALSAGVSLVPLSANAVLGCNATEKLAVAAAPRDPIGPADNG